MRSSTSSSNDRIASLRWGRLWLAILGLTAALLLAWEVGLRANGFRQGSAETDGWVHARGRVRPDVPVFVGSSRIGAALDPAVWRREVGGRLPAQLAQPGGNTLRVLEHVAADARAGGLVVAEILPYFTFEVSRDSGDWSDGPAMRAYDESRSSPAQRSEATLQTWASGLFVLRNYELSLGNVTSLALYRRQFPQPSLVRFHANRFLAIHFREGREDGRFVAADSAFDVPIGSPASGATLEEMLGRLNRAADAIADRGGEVVFVLLPVCGERARMEEDHFPRAEYWDRFVASTRHPTVAVADLPAFQTPECFDGSHMDVADARVFTGELARYLADRPPGGTR